MEVILLEKIANLGELGDKVKVKAGYGRNYLIPQGMARVATEGAVKQQKEEQKQQARKKAAVREDAVDLKEELEGMQVVFSAKVGEENRIFGTVTTQQIAVELANRGYDIDRRDIELDEEIRQVGAYTAHIKIHDDVVADLDLQVIPESG